MNDYPKNASKFISTTQQGEYHNMIIFDFREIIFRFTCFIYLIPIFYIV